MAKLKSKATIQTNITLSVTEEEMRALDALVGYGTKEFLDVFYNHMGRAYLEPHEKGLRSLFECIRKEFPSILSRADKARKSFEE